MKLLTGRCFARPGWAALAPVLALLVLAGCGDGKPAVNSSTTEEGTVRGKVTLGGQPLTGGQLVFNPANYQRKSAPTRSASIGDDGTYTVKTLTGSNLVMVSPKRATPGAKAGTDPYEMIPLEVNPGDNTFNINLTPRLPRLHPSKVGRRYGSTPRNRRRVRWRSRLKVH